MIKLICSDVDGTMVPDGSRDINPELFEVICRLREKGVQFAIASGRPASSISSLFKPVEDKVFFIALGGAIIATSSRTLYHWDVDQEDMRRMVQKMRTVPGCEIMLNGVNRSYLESKDEYFRSWIMDSYGTKCQITEDLLSVDDQVVSVSFYHSGHQVDTAFRDFIEEWQDRYSVVTAGTMWLDVHRKDVNKGRAIEELQDSLAVTPEETMVFGDQRNDIEMMGRAFYSYAVENALPEVKKAARFGTDRCDQDGVLKVLKELLQKL